MSTGPAPPNPGSPKTPLHRPRPLLPRVAGPLLLGSLGLGVLYTYFATRPPAPPGTAPADPLRTPGVRNIENAYTNGGATRSHTPAYGGTVQGTTGRRIDDAELRDGAGSGEQLKLGFRTEGVGEDQRPSQSGWLGRTWHRMIYRSDKGK